MNAPAENTSKSTRRIALLALACLLVGFVAMVAETSRQLPERVATHFDFHGKANGWMSRSQHVKLTIGVGVGAPVLILGVFALVRKMKGWGLNIPNKDFWLAPERQKATFDFLQEQGIRLAGLLVAFHGGMFVCIAIANQHRPVLLPVTYVAWLTGGFLVFLAAWIAVLVLRFRLPAA